MAINEKICMKTAENLINQAEKKLKSFSIELLGYNDKTSRYEFAIEKYYNAALQYKMAKQFDIASNCYTTCASLSLEIGKYHDAIGYYIQCAKAYLMNKKYSEAIDCYSKAIKVSLDNGCYNKIGEYYNEIGEMYEILGDISNSIIAFEQAIIYYKLNDDKLNAIKIMEKIAQYKSENDDYIGSINLFEEIIKELISFNKTMMNYRIRDVAFKLSLVYIAYSSTINDMNYLSTKIDDVIILSPSSNEFREGIFINSLVKSLKSNNLEEFNKYIREYDRVIALNNWQSSMLLVGQRKLMKKDSNGNNGLEDLVGVENNKFSGLEDLC